MSIADKVTSLPADETDTQTGSYGDTQFKYQVEGRYDDGVARVSALTFELPLAVDRPGDREATTQKLKNVAQHVSDRSALLGYDDQREEREAEPRAGPTVRMANYDGSLEAYLEPDEVRIEQQPDGPIVATPDEVQTTLDALVEATDMPYTEVSFDDGPAGKRGGPR